MSRRGRLALWAVLVGLILPGQLIWLWLLRGPRILAADALLIGGHITLGLLLLAMLGLLRTTPASAIRLSRPASNAIILLGALGLQVAALVLLWPALSEDVVRYRLEGGMWLAGRSPYATSPEAFFHQQPRRADAVDRMVTYPHMHTIYPPVTQVAFVVGRGLEEFITPALRVVAGPKGHLQSPPPPAGPWRRALGELTWLQRGGVFRLMMAAAAMLALAIMLRLLADMNRSAWWAALVAWHPLWVMETAGNAHSDILGIVLLLAMLLDVQRGRYLPAAGLLGLACCVKPHAIVLLPFIWRAAWQHQQQSRHKIDPHWRVPVVVLGVILALYLPALTIGDGWRGWLETARIYSRHWEANGSIYELLKAWIGRGDDHRIVFAKRVARWLPPLALVITGAILWWRGWRPDQDDRTTLQPELPDAPASHLGMAAKVAHTGYWLMLILLLPAPVVYPWYLLWVMAFVPFIPARSAWAGLTWAMMIVLSYLLWRQPDWILPRWASLLEYVPVYSVLMLQGVYAIHAKKISTDIQTPVRT